MITLDEFKAGKAELEDIVSSLVAFQNEEFSITYGFHPDAPNALGWMMITKDYPSYIVFSLGETLWAASEKLASWKSEEEEEDEDD